MQKQHYASFRFTLAAGRSLTIPVYGTGFRVLDNSLATNPEISIEGGSFYEIAAGTGAKHLPAFSRLEFRNPSASNMALWIAVTEGEIDDTRTIITATGGTGQLPVKDVSHVIQMVSSGSATGSDCRILPRSILINNAAAVDKGGGKVGIPLTSQPFNPLESVTITGTVNYNGPRSVDITSSANEVVIAATYVAETFDGVNDRIGSTILFSVPANLARKELIIYNQHATLPVYWGLSSISSPGTPAGMSGIPIIAKTIFILTCTAQVFFVADDTAGVAGITISINSLSTS